MEDAHMRSWDECCKNFDVDTETGLKEAQVKTNLEKYGPNGKRKCLKFGSMLL